MRRIEKMGEVGYRDGKWKRQVVEYWLWCDEPTIEVCKILKISRPLLNQWHRWYFKTRNLPQKSSTHHLSPSLIAWQKKQLMKNKKLEQQLALDAQNVELLQKQIARLESALKDEQLRIEGYSTMIDIAEKEFKIEIRKKFGAKR